MAETDKDEQAREEVREKLRKSMDKLVGQDNKPEDEQPKKKDDTDLDNPIPITKSG